MSTTNDYNDVSFVEELLSIVDDKTKKKMEEKAKGLARLITYYRCATMEIECKFNVLNEEYSLEFDRNPISSIKTRVKAPMSIMEKLRRKGRDISLESIEQLNDVAGVRVICSFESDVYMLADALLKQDDITLIERRDYIKNPKENGYRSLHLIVAVPIFLSNEKRLVKVEIQLRTIAMDFWASLEHQLRYKKDFCISEQMEQELLDCAQTSAELDAKMDVLRKSIYAQNGSSAKSMKRKSLQKTAAYNNSKVQ